MCYLPLSKDHQRAVQQSLAEQGYELTLEQIAAMRRTELARARQEMRKRGYREEEIPKTDIGMTALLQRRDSLRQLLGMAE